MVESSKANIKMIKSKATVSILGLIKENIREIGQMENNMDLENTSLLKKNKVGKRSKKKSAAYGKMEKEFNGLLMKWSNK